MWCRWRLKWRDSYSSSYMFYSIRCGNGASVLFSWAIEIKNFSVALTLFVKETFLNKNKLNSHSDSQQQNISIFHMEDYWIVPSSVTHRYKGRVKRRRSTYTHDLPLRRYQRALKSPASRSDTLPPWRMLRASHQSPSRVIPRWCQTLANRSAESAEKRTSFRQPVLIS